MGLISSAISAVGTFISGAVSSIGAAVSGFAKSAVSIIAKIPIPGLEVVRVISIAAEIVHAIVSFLGIKTEDDPEILGAKAQQCERSLEKDFDNDVEAYIKYLKEEVELDQKKFDELTPEERIGCKAIGMTLETKAIEQKVGGIYVSPECLATLTKIHEAGIYMEAKELVDIVNKLKSEGITNLNDVVEFLAGKGDSDRIKTGEALASALGENATEKIYKLQDAVRQYE